MFHGTSEARRLVNTWREVLNDCAPTRVRGVSSQSFNTQNVGQCSVPSFGRYKCGPGCGAEVFDGYRSNSYAAALDRFANRDRRARRTPWMGPRACRPPCFTDRRMAAFERNSRQDDKPSSQKTLA